MTSKTIAKYTLLFVFALVGAFSLGELVGALAVARPLSQLSFPQFGLICSGLWAGIELTEVALKHAPQAINKAVDL